MRPDIDAGPIGRKYSESNGLAELPRGGLLTADGERRGRDRGGQGHRGNDQAKMLHQRNCLQGALRVGVILHGRIRTRNTLVRWNDFTALSQQFTCAADGHAFPGRPVDTSAAWTQRCEHRGVCLSAQWGGVYQPRALRRPLGGAGSRGHSSLWTSTRRTYWSTSASPFCSRGLARSTRMRSPSRRTPGGRKLRDRQRRAGKAEQPAHRLHPHHQDGEGREIRLPLDL